MTSLIGSLDTETAVDLLLKHGLVLETETVLDIQSDLLSLELPDMIQMIEEFGYDKVLKSLDNVIHWFSVRDKTISKWAADMKQSILDNYVKPQGI